MRYPRVALKDMDAAMLSFELLREIDRVIDDPRGREMISSAAMLATHLHRDQTRKARKNMPRTPYIEHPMRVTLRLFRWDVTDSSVLTAALFHDVVEDCADQLAALCGVSSGTAAELREAAVDYLRKNYGAQVADIVEAVSNPLAGDYHAHLEEMAEHASLGALWVKASDFIDNAASLPHQRGDVPEAFIIKRVPKYLHASPILISGFTTRQKYQTPATSQQALHELESTREKLLVLADEML